MSWHCVQPPCAVPALMVERLCAVTTPTRQLFNCPWQTLQRVSPSAVAVEFAAVDQRRAQSPLSVWQPEAALIPVPLQVPEFAAASVHVLFARVMNRSVL